MHDLSLLDLPFVEEMSQKKLLASILLQHDEYVTGFSDMILLHALVCLHGHFPEMLLRGIPAAAHMKLDLKKITPQKQQNGDRMIETSIS
jgi:cytosine/adenosine deaminase-related metal-dependent hydrolase